ncbi:conserved hypothetical protein [Mycobacterium avium 104]|nr:conserved hypothetical protein [Mycobacterium avium 104]
MFAGGDPWKINATLQSGRPAQISNLAKAFHDAGRSTGEAEAAFNLARGRFEQAWTHENDENPINGSAEVQRTTTSLGVQAAQLPKIGADLEKVAAALAEAQRSGRGEISSLEGALQDLDDQVGEAVELEKNPQLTASERQLLDHYIDGLEKHAIDDTKASVANLTRIRDQYSQQLHTSMANLREQDGYDPPIQAFDGDVPESPSQEQRRHNQIEAFKQVFGREPASAADWETAAALDSQTYDSKFNGAKSEIRVVRIRPVPGQGVVRVSQWIEQRDVRSFPPWKRDLGNNRGANPNFDPEDTKVRCADSPTRHRLWTSHRHPFCAPSAHRQCSSRLITKSGRLVMRSSAREPFFDAEAWRIATVSAPFVVQGVLALLMLTLWLLGEGPFKTHSAYAGERAWMVTASLIASAVSLSISVPLAWTPSSRRRGISLSLAGCSALVLVGGVLYAYLTMR